MRLSISLILAACLSSTSLFAGETMSAADRERLVEKLDASRLALTNSVEGLSEAQWTYKPGPGRWSVAECVEHIAATEGFILNLMADFMSSPPATDDLGDEVRKDETVTSVITDRSKKMKAPDPLQPTNRFGGHNESLAEFDRIRSKTIRLVKITQDLRAYAGDHPVFGRMDALGWILFISGHSERHTAQIEEVKGDPGFPD